MPNRLGVKFPPRSYSRYVADVNYIMTVLALLSIAAQNGVSSNDFGNAVACRRWIAEAERMFPDGVASVHPYLMRAGRKRDRAAFERVMRLIEMARAFIRKLYWDGERLAYIYRPNGDLGCLNFTSPRL